MTNKINWANFNKFFLVFGLFLGTLSAGSSSAADCVMTGTTGAEIFAYNNCLLNPPTENTAQFTTPSAQEWDNLNARLQRLEVENRLITARISQLEAVLLQNLKP
ncbi:MAG: hypothetical protein ACI9O0_001049 [Paracoccaceae bacterium]|jgi:hypothetical protein